ncbi:helix-turn-helix domain-containing protein [Paenibacillus agaridevorans]|uniref:helix-turn-helix domain-containing protein n=1 Tax=Paenibacillus agaridevorans TaxID=171404 RepID=UPI001BE41948|nr:helix-turn-helix domain-containing protein [Paenibacillus agaridevorans]
MYRLLLVDDEPIIVNSMYQLFREAVHLDIEIYRAYTVYEALDFLQHHRIDLVLSDIRMPGLSGIELQKIIIDKWPMCKIIFLTGFNDFDYAKQAIRNGGVTDYLLKHEDDDMILQSVEKAIAQIAKQALSDSFALQSKTKLQLALSAAQKNVLFDLINGNKPLPKFLDQKFGQLEMPLKVDQQVYQIIGRIDSWDQVEVEGEKDRELLAFAVQNIVNEYLGSAAVCVSVVFEHYKYLWLMQPTDCHLDHSDKEMEQQWKLLTARVQGILEDAQFACKNVINVSVSFAVSYEPVTWEEFGNQFHYLKMLLGHGHDGKNELLIQEGNRLGGLDIDKSRRYFADSQQLRKQLGQLEEYLESGQAEEFMELYGQVMRRDPSHSQADLLELFYSVSLYLLSFSNRTGLLHILSSKMNIGKMTQYDAHETWDGIIRYFMEFAQLLFDNRQSSPEMGMQRTIQIIQQYVQSHLNQELTLTNLAELVNHSPAYLSRLYKKETEVTLFDYITGCRMAKAKELLSKTAMKIHKIAGEVGYESPPQFTRSFKKWFKVTPQEYRDTFQILDQS